MKEAKSVYVNKIKNGSFSFRQEGAYLFTLSASPRSHLYLWLVCKSENGYHLYVYKYEVGYAFSDAIDRKTMKTMEFERYTHKHTHTQWGTEQRNDDCTFLH